MATGPEDQDLEQGRRMPNQPHRVAVVGTVSTSSDVSLRRTATTPTPDQPLWVAIRNRTRAIGFNRYHNFINRILCEDVDENNPNTYPPQYSTGQLPQGEYGEPSVLDKRKNLLNPAKRPTIHGVDAYRLLKLATEAFLIFECGVVIDGTLELEEERRRLGHLYDDDTTSLDPTTRIKKPTQGLS